MTPPTQRGQKTGKLIAAWKSARAVVTGQPAPAKRRRSEEDFAAAKMHTRRAARPRPQKQAYSDAADYLANILDWLNLWQDNAGGSSDLDGDCHYTQPRNPYLAAHL